MHTNLIKISNNFNRIIDLLKYDVIEKKPTKRSLIPVIGFLYKQLFGLVDQATEYELRNLIKTTANDTSKTAGLLANRTELISKKFSNIHDSTNYLDDQINKLKKIQNNARTDELFTNISSLLYNNLIQYQLDTMIFTNSIILANLGFMHPHFFDPSEIPKFINTIPSKSINTVFPTQVIQSYLADVIKI